VRVPFLDLSREVGEMRSELDDAIARTIDGGQFVLGPAVERFERDFAAFCGVEHAVGVASGTDALELALRATGIDEGDEVLAPANTCIPTIAAIEAAGADPVLVDVDPRTRTIDPDLLEAAVRPRVRAIVAVHLYGRCAPMGAVLELAAARDLVVVEDAAQAHGAEHEGRRAGALGRVAAFSFYPTKNLGALGDGGAVVTDDAELAERVRRLRSYGERERYLSVTTGTNSRLDELQASVLLTKLARLEAWNDRRRVLAALYDELLEGAELELPEHPERGRHAYHLYVVRVRERDRVREQLAGAGIGTAVHYPRAVHEHPAYSRLGSGRELGVSEALAREVLSLPLYPGLRDDEVEAVAAAVRTAVGHKER
jgi:dTDP-3-amino-3,4,6-trideoxy-alpha-D-glucose transaminase